MQFVVRTSNVLQKLPSFNFSSLFQGFFYTCLTQSIMVLQLRIGWVRNSHLHVLNIASILPGEPWMPDLASVLLYRSDEGTENIH